MSGGGGTPGRPLSPGSLATPLGFALPAHKKEEIDTFKSEIMLEKRLLLIEKLAMEKALGARKLQSEKII